jgi:hypothetical protein
MYLLLYRFTKFVMLKNIDHSTLYFSVEEYNYTIITEWEKIAKFGIELC